jgi:hypothetical protein
MVLISPKFIKDKNGNFIKDKNGNFIEDRNIEDKRTCCFTKFISSLFLSIITAIIKK